MNPMVQARMTRIREATSALRETLEAERDELAKQHKEKEELLQEQWRHRKELTTLQRVQKEYDELISLNEQFARERKHLRERCMRILNFAKALRAAHEG